MQELDNKFSTALEKAIVNTEWLVLPGTEADQFKFVLESDWSTNHAGYMLFACRGHEERLVDLGSRVQQIPTSSYLGELDALVWACKSTKAFRGETPVVVRSDNQALIEKWKSNNLYESDIRAFRRWGWLLANELGIRFEFVPGTENIGADLLSRPKFGKRVMDISSPTTRDVNQISVWNEIWDEHMRAHWGAHKTYLALQSRGSKASLRMVKKVCEMCEVCAKFRQDRAHAWYGQPPFSLEPGHTIFADVVGPLVRGRGGVRHIHCLVDSATRMGDAMKFRVVNTGSVIRAVVPPPGGAALPGS